MLQQQILDDPEEVLFNALRRDKCIRHPNSDYVLFVREVQGRRLLDVVLKRRVKVKDPRTGAETFIGYDLVARAREARLEVDVEAGVLFIHPDRFTFDDDRKTQGTTATNGPLPVKKALVEFKPPPGMSRSGKPAPASA